jgi:hypothetical protein
MRSFPENGGLFLLVLDVKFSVFTDYKKFID